MASKDREHIRKLREEANALRQKEEARRRRNRMLTQVGIVIGAVVVIGAIVLLVVMGPKWFGNQRTPESSGMIEVTDSEGQPVEVPITVSNDGILVGEEDAPDVIDYYFDFSCPHCAEYHAVVDEDIKTLIADGEVQVNYHMIRFVAEYGLLAGATTAAVIEYQPELFYTVMDGLFAVPAEQQTGWSYDDYSQHLATLGVTSTEAIEDTANGEFSWWLSDRTDQARKDGIPGTPTIMIDGEIQEQLPVSAEEFRAIIAGEELPEPSVEAPISTQEQSPAETPAG
ncbi:thioredoxin domain-containing protein [Gulosibacter sp. 10]|uniref:DsbA family protein n=1 Tax=Gulosibacter sp. 10 TaxID=1255570 RepID=UPI00097EDF3D|nr:thioredoxin domain-containing protein [Gulosibacter sp. 10]SJM54566.1 putative membrane protein [Gulosibacter sp. 10]